ncbi:hypothetical protein AaE_005835, partial [Aphanomyces astaci]
DRRPLFDIKASAQTIVHKLEQQHHPHKDATPVGFDQVVQDMSSYEICRIFSAVLHLANEGAVELHHDENDDEHESMDTLRLTMLTHEESSAMPVSRRHHAPRK